MEYTIYWLWLSLHCTPGSVTYALLRKSFASPYDVYHASEDELKEALKEYPMDLKLLCDKDITSARKLLDYCARTGIRIISYDCDEFPKGLRSISDPPVLLYCLGKIPSSDENTFISVVGTRKMSDYGKRMAFEISADLATAGAVVVSGLALGVDGVSHAAAMSVRAKTVAVLGNGVDSVYPSVHKRLASFVANCGAVVSEFPPGSEPQAWNFPIRNRIISGMSDATVVIEADEVSGALITARRAVEQGKKVYALPGNVDEENSHGISLLIKDGAKAISCADDVLNDFDSIFDAKINIFKLLKRKAIPVDSTLEKYGVHSRPYKDKNAIRSDEARRRERAGRNTQLGNSAPHAADEPKTEVKKTENPILATLEPFVKEIYGRIPEEGSAELDNVVREDDPQEVMTALTLLEMYELITFLSGNIVKRL